MSKKPNHVEPLRPLLLQNRLVTLSCCAAAVILGLGSMAANANDIGGGTVQGIIQLKSGDKTLNTVVYLKEIEGVFPIPETTPLMDQQDKVFVPHLLPIQKGQVVDFANGDLFNHNLHAYWGRRSMFNVIQAIKGKHEWKPPRAGEYLILCDLHREMSAFVFVFDHPFFTSVVNKRSSADFKIEGIPDGTYMLVAVRDVDKRLVRKQQEVEIRSGQVTTEVDPENWTIC